MKIIGLLILCIVGIIFTSCSGNSTDTAYSRAGYLTEYATISNTPLSTAYTVAEQQAGKLSIWDELSALGVRIQGLHITEDGEAELLVHSPSFAVIPSSPFGIDDDETLEVLLDAIDMIMEIGAYRVSFISCMRDGLQRNGLWETLLRTLNETAESPWTEEDFAIEMWSAEYMELWSRVIPEEEAAFPSFVEDSYIDILARLGFEFTYTTRFESIIITPIANAQPNITTEDDATQLLAVFFHLVDISYDEGGINITAVRASLEEAGLWPMFVENAQGRFMEKLEGYAHHLAHLESKGVLVEYSFLNPGEEINRSIYFHDVWMPRNSRFTLIPDVEFAITCETELEMMVQLMVLFLYSTTSIHIGFDRPYDVRQALSEEMQERFTAIDQAARRDSLMQNLREREQRVEAFLSQQQ